MQTFKPSLIAFLAGVAVLQLNAQPASPELVDKAVELLRQTISQEQPGSSPRTAGTPEAPATAAQPAAPAAPVAPTAAATAPATPEQQQQAIELLREKILQEQTMATPSAGQPAPSAKPKKPSSSKRTPAAPKAGSPARQSEAAARTPSAPEAVAPGEGTVPEQPAAPKTKQQRLMELLELYKADKLTPAEYHAERAKILAEP